LSSHDDRRGQGADRQVPREGERSARQRRAPLFPLEADDIVPKARRAPPAPLRDLVSDINDAIPLRGVPAQPAQHEARSAPAARADTRLSQAGRQPAAASISPAALQGQAAPSAARPVITQVPARPRQELRVPAPERRLDAPAASLGDAHARYRAIDSELARVELAAARPRPSAAYVAPAAPRSAGNNTTLLLGLICVVSLLIIFTLGRGTSIDVSSGWTVVQEAGEATTSQLVAVTRSAGDYALKGPPSLTPQQIDSILAEYGSPATGTGEVWYNLGLQYGIDPAFAVAFFIHESGAGSNPAWAGIKPGGGTTHNVGNIICAGYATCYGRFRDYPSWSEGIEDWYRLIDVEYLQGRGHKTVADIIPVYAPSFENDVNGYVNAVHNLVDQWRTAGAP
jgi:hypothetical protein